jgi:hypothetical protein
MRVSDIWTLRAQDLARHIADLQDKSYERARSREDKEAIFRTAFQLTTPAALDVLESINRVYLDGRGLTATHVPDSDGSGGLIGVWRLTWPELSSALDRIHGRPIAPVELNAVFPAGWTHGHLVLFTSQDPREIVASWPFQVTTKEDAARQEPILWAIAEAELHERVLRAGHSVLGDFASRFTTTRPER